MKLTMVGTGYVGLVTGSCLANTGNEVVCLDIDEKKVARLKQGDCPIYEPGLSELIRRNAASGRLRFTSDKRNAYGEAEAILICVGTPPTSIDEEGSSDLAAVFQVAKDIAEALESVRPQAPPKLVVVKSTVPVGTSHRVRDLIRSRTKLPFLIANNPEFLKEGAAVNDFMKPDRVVCGVEDEAAATILRDLYEPFVRQGNPIIMMDVRSSEMVKYASNAMLACKISFINEIANLCEHYGADIRAVREGMCSDHRIGKQFLHPGLGFGGSCFPKDLVAVIGMGRTVGFDCKLTRAVHAVNQDQRRYFWNKIIDHFGEDLSGRTLSFWGVAFKPETDDIREAPSLTLMQWVLEANARVRAYDPVATDHLREAMAEVTPVDDMYDVLTGSDALVICTEWSELRHPDFDRMAQAMRGKVIFDGRNIFRKDLMERLGFAYYSVGREPVLPPAAGKDAAMPPASTVGGRSVEVRPD
ncbi:MAG: UDP-glucose dehydrogenase family protein [Planctomycetota bacterium]|jgi:UDPglucose 6-dehydrogenase